jgi:hypothetical protein
VQKYEALSQQNEQLIAELARKERIIAEKDALSAAERSALYQFTADSLDSQLVSTSGKTNESGTGDGELDYKRLKRAVFMSMHALQADPSIADSTLQQLVKRGHEWIAKVSPRLVAEFPDIRIARLRWLEDAAIPALQREFDALRHSPVQRAAETKVVLPQEVWILSEEAGGIPTVVLTDLNSLKEEVRLIKDKLEQ